ncbi:nucleotide-binding universal stress UspA family protein [Flavobacteriaceae bacterium MAR_2010_72]|nr:nucleotide-binding universal stress UspA family protein [Flavobacteriaceae bacterium MAR_2010_72]TVZ58567.1 nucleotide-binding universal stress UspA family protein [Flavobacteriaceae bacterium MAR_2010_105]
MKKILVPTDFSKTAEHALKVAAQLAKTYDFEIYLLHLLELPLQEVDPMNAHSELPEAMFFMKLAHQKFEDLMAKDFLEGIKVHETIKADSSFSGIIDKCHELNIDFIVMGSHGVSGLKELFIGSNAEKVVRTSDIPVLVVKKSLEDFHVYDFVFASNFKKECKHTYKQAIEFARLFDAKIHLLMVNTASKFITSKDAKARILDFIKNTQFENYSINIYNDKSVEAGILNFASEIDADLIGISTYGRQGLAHFFSSNISEDLVNHAQRPVMTFKI